MTIKHINEYIAFHLKFITAFTLLFFCFNIGLLLIEGIEEFINDFIKHVTILAILTFYYIRKCKIVITEDFLKTYIPSFGKQYTSIEYNNIISARIKHIIWWKFIIIESSSSEKYVWIPLHVKKLPLFISEIIKRLDEKNSLKTCLENHYKTLP